MSEKNKLPSQLSLICEITEIYLRAYCTIRILDVDLYIQTELFQLENKILRLLVYGSRMNDKNQEYDRKSFEQFLRMVFHDDVTVESHKQVYEDLKNLEYLMNPISDTATDSPEYSNTTRLKAYMRKFVAIREMTKTNSLLDSPNGMKVPFSPSLRSDSSHSSKAKSTSSDRRENDVSDYSYQPEVFLVTEFNDSFQLSETSTGTIWAENSDTSPEIPNTNSVHSFTNGKSICIFVCPYCKASVFFCVKCRFCGLKVHSKCKSQVPSECPKTKISQKSDTSGSMEAPKISRSLSTVMKSKSLRESKKGSPLNMLKKLSIGTKKSIEKHSSLNDRRRSSEKHPTLKSSRRRKIENDPSNISFTPNSLDVCSSSSKFSFSANDVSNDSSLLSVGTPSASSQKLGSITKPYVEFSGQAQNVSISNIDFMKTPGASIRINPFMKSYIMSSRNMSQDSSDCRDTLGSRDSPSIQYSTSCSSADMANGQSQKYFVDPHTNPSIILKLSAKPKISGTTSLPPIPQTLLDTMSTKLSDSSSTNEMNPLVIVKAADELEPVEIIHSKLIFDDIIYSSDQCTRLMLSEASSCSYKAKFDDVTNVNFLAYSRFGVYYSGHHHGNVTVLKLNVPHESWTPQELQDFEYRILRLRNARHTNITLIDKVCFESPSIITIGTRGTPLYDILHGNDFLGISERDLVHYIKQLLQGLSYLHSQHIVHKNFTSQSTFMIKNKLILSEFGLVTEENQKNYFHWTTNGVQIPRKWLYYQPAEVLSHININSPGSEVNFCSMASDVFAFGTIVYEMLYFRFPRDTQDAQQIMYEVCSGIPWQYFSITKENPIIANFLNDCWKIDPNLRPTSKELLDQAQKLTSLFKLCRSTSNPHIT